MVPLALIANLKLELPYIEKDVAILLDENFDDIPDVLYFHSRLKDFLAETKIISNITVQAHFDAIERPILQLHYKNAITDDKPLVDFWIDFKHHFTSERGVYLPYWKAFGIINNLKLKTKQEFITETSDIDIIELFINKLRAI